MSGSCLGRLRVVSRWNWAKDSETQKERILTKRTFCERFPSPCISKIFFFANSLAASVGYSCYKLLNNVAKVRSIYQKTAPRDGAVEWRGEVWRLYSLQQFAATHLHAVEGEPFFAKVFDAGTKVIDCLVDAEEAGVRAVKGNNIYRRILRVVLLNIQ